MRNPRQTLSPQNAAYVFRSSLDDPPLRFLACAIAYSLHTGLRSPSDFVRHFPPIDIMTALAGQPELRALILEETTGMKRGLALHKSEEAAAADLQLYLDHSATSPAAIIALLNPDDIVRQIPRERSWRYIVEDKFWLLDASHADGYELAKKYVAFLLATALCEGLVTPSRVVAALTMERLALRLPRPVLAELLTQTFVDGNEAPRVTGDQVLTAISPAILVDHIPLADIWRVVVLPQIARAQRFEAACDAPSDRVATTMERPPKPAAEPLPSPPPAPPPIRSEANQSDLELDVVIDELCCEDVNAGAAAKTVAPPPPPPPVPAGVRQVLEDATVRLPHPRVTIRPKAPSPPVS